MSSGAAVAAPFCVAALLAAGIALFGPRDRLAVAMAALAVLLVVSAGAVFWIGHADRVAQRSALVSRAGELSAGAFASGSALSCLAGDVGEAVETACERVVFASPQSVASAVAYTSARLTLITDTLDYANRSEPEFAARLDGVRRAVELDRYGLAAQVLSTRDGCSVDHCPFFALARDSTALKANIKAHAYDTYVARYEPAWTAEKAAPPVAAPEPVPAPQARAPEAEPVPSKYDFPSAASIPPVSIMNPEPPRPKEVDGPEPTTGAAPSAGAKLPMPPKRPQSQATAPPDQ
jgi:hypothetical protein